MGLANPKITGLRVGFHTGAHGPLRSDGDPKKRGVATPRIFTRTLKLRRPEKRGVATWDPDPTHLQPHPQVPEKERFPYFRNLRMA